MNQDAVKKQKARKHLICKLLYVLTSRCVARRGIEPTYY